MAEVTNSSLFDINTGILPENACVVIIKTDWNTAVINELEAGCMRVFGKYGVTNVRSFSVPGAFEIPFAIRQYWDMFKYKDNKPHVFIALACVIRGDTPHFDYVCQGITNGVMNLNLQLPVPTIFGVLTVNNQQQAEERLGGIHGHKGEEAAITALKMISLPGQFKQ